MTDLTVLITPERMSLLYSFGLKVLGSLLILLAALFFSRWIENFLNRSFNRSKLDPMLARFFSNISRWLILVLAVITCLGVFGIQTASFAAVLASISLAIGLSLQGSLSNFAAGVMLLIFRPFKVGDFIRTSGESGTVFQIDLLTTTMDTPDNRRIILPNSKVFGSNIENVTFHSERRIDLDVGTDYSADIDRVRAVLEEAVQELPDLISARHSQIVLQGLGASSIDWQIRIWCKREDFLKVRQACIRMVKYKLDAANINIPFPQMDVHYVPQCATENNK
ncbi:MAG: mechanosensitive ion channel family protein [Oligoflexus sp.]